MENVSFQLLPPNTRLAIQGHTSTNNFSAEAATSILFLSNAWQGLQNPEQQHRTCFQEQLYSTHTPCFVLRLHCTTDRKDVHGHEVPCSVLALLPYRYLLWIQHIRVWPCLKTEMSQKHLKIFSLKIWNTMISMKFCQKGNVAFQDNGSSLI